MKKIFKWTLYGFLTVLFAGFIFYLYAYFSTQARLAKKYDVELPSFNLKSDSAILAEGNRLMTVKGCRDCHGDDLGGKIWLDDPMLGRIVTPNLTRGNGGLGDYSTQDWLTALKHGLSRNRTPLLIMPSTEFSISGNVGKWTEAEFITALRTGVTPEGKILKQEEMPWTITQHYTDVELKALHTYLKSL